MLLFLFFFLGFFTVAGLQTFNFWAVALAWFVRLDLSVGRVVLGRSGRLGDKRSSIGNDTLLPRLFKVDARTGCFMNVSSVADFFFLRKDRTEAMTSKWVDHNFGELMFLKHPVRSTGDHFSSGHSSCDV